MSRERPFPFMIHLATQQKVSLAFAVALGTSAAIGLLAYVSVAQLRDESVRVAHTQEVISALETLLSTTGDTDAASQAYVVTGDEALLWPYDATLDDVGGELSRLKRLTEDNPSQQERLARLSGLAAEHMSRNADIVAARRDNDVERARRLVADERGRQLHDAIHGTVREMVLEERGLLRERRTRTHRSSSTALEAISVGTLLALLVTALAHVLIRRDFAGARRAQAALREANSNLESRIAERTQQLERANEHLGSVYQDLRLLVAQTPLAIAMFDRDMHYIATSQRWFSVFGGGSAGLTGPSHYAVHPDLPQSWVDIHRRALGGEFLKNDEELWVRSDGSRYWLRWAVSPWRNECGETGGVIIYAEDITPRKLAEERLRLAHAVFENVQEGIVIADLDGIIVTANPAFRAISEYSESELVSRGMRLASSGPHERAFYEEIWACIRSTGSWQGEIWDERKGGESYPQWLGISTVRNEEGAPSYYVGVVADISRMRHAQSHLHYLVHHDALTGLANRALLSLRLRHTIERTQRIEAQCAVLFLDLDGFKRVNDLWGHQAGDELLRLAARRMKDRVREVDTLARLGGDEFVLVLEQVCSPADVADFARELIAQLGAPFTLKTGCQVSVGISIGISLCPADGDDAESLVRLADTALYRAKQAGRGTWRFHSVEDPVEVSTVCG